MQQFINNLPAVRKGVMIVRWYNLSWSKVVEFLQSNVYKGISSDEVEERRQHYGNNKLDINIEEKIKKAIKSIIQPYIVIYLAAVIALFAFKSYVIAAISLLIFISMLSIKIYLEIVEIRQYKPFLNLNDADVKVIRDHNSKTIKAHELVVGDIVEIEPGVVPADIRITECENIKTYEKNITGEKFIIEKYATRVEDSVKSFTEMKNILFKGTNVVSGTGYGIVVNTGINTEIGKIINSMSVIKEKNNGFINGLYSSVNKYTSLGALLILLVLGVQKVIFKNLSNEIIISFLSIFVTIFPILNIIASVFVTKKYLYSKGIELIRTGAIDKIPDVNMIFIPKEGGIFERQVKAKQIYVNNKLEYIHNIEEIDPTLMRLMEVSLLCNDATYDPDTGKFTGEPCDAALLEVAYKRDIYRGDLLKLQNRLFEIPYDSDRRMMTSVNRYKKKFRANIKGAVDEIIEKSTHIMKDGVEVEMTEQDIENIKQADFKMSNEGYTTMAVAYRNFNYEPSEDENIESNLVFVGIVSFRAELIKDIKSKVDKIRAAGIVPVIFTDDNKITSANMGQEIGIARSVFNVMSGVELENMKSEEFKKTVLKTRIFSRVSNGLKNKILNIFMNEGYKVAMYGENINDMVMMKSAHISISDGSKCPSIVKRLSDIYMKKDFLSGFMRLFKYEKRFAKNVNQYIQYLIFILISEIVLMSANINMNYLSIINPYVIAAFNLIIIPFMLQPILFNDSSSRNKNKFYNYLIGSIIEIVSVVIIIELYPQINREFIIIFSYLSFILISSVIQNDINVFKNKMIGINYLIVALIMIITLCLLFLKLSVTSEELNYALIIWIIFVIIEFLLKKWRQ